MTTHTQRLIGCITHQLGLLSVRPLTLLCTATSNHRTSKMSGKRRSIFGDGSSSSGGSDVEEELLIKKVLGWWDGIRF